MRRAHYDIRNLIPLDPSHEFNSGRRRHEPAPPVSQVQHNRPKYPPYRPPPSQPGGWGNPQPYNGPSYGSSMNRPPPGPFGNYPPGPGPHQSNGFPSGPSSFNNRPYNPSYPLQSQPLRPPIQSRPIPGGPRNGIPQPSFALASPGVRPGVPNAPFILAGPHAGAPFRPPTGPGGTKRAQPVFAGDMGRDEQRRRGADEGLPYDRG